MSRYLFVVPPLTGHVNPTIPVGQELAARGHDVAWTGPREVVAELLPADAPFLPVTLPEALSASITERAPERRGLTALKHLIGDFLVPLAHGMLPGVRDAVAEFKPDALLVDQQALAGLAVAETNGLPWATSATTSANLYDQMALMPQVQQWADDLQRDFLRSAGLDDDVAAALDLRFSERLVLVFSTEAFVGPGDYPDHYAFVGPSIEARPDDTPFDWDWLGAAGAAADPVVLVSLGTLNWHNGGRFFAAAAEALAGLAVRAIVIAPPELVGNAPPNVLVTPRVPQLALMPHLDAVVSHGGHNTVCEALAHGLPLVVAPIRDDQPAIADQVVRAGAGVRVAFRRVGADELRGAIEVALTDDALRDGAARVQASFAAAGGPSVAADHLERLSA
ncbi:MAG TPA: glycosyltransferase [Acidimicrobiales bacterium]|nr:glycosyltransferase [Acidimicrobiales bacterium]